MNTAVIQELKTYLENYQSLKIDLEADFSAILNLPAEEYYYCFIKNLSIDQCPARANAISARDEILISMSMYLFLT